MTHPFQWYKPYMKVEGDHLTIKHGICVCLITKSHFVHELVLFTFKKTAKWKLLLSFFSSLYSGVKTFVFVKGGGGGGIGFRIDGFGLKNRTDCGFLR